MGLIYAMIANIVPKYPTPSKSTVLSYVLPRKNEQVTAWAIIMIFFTKTSFD